MNKVKLTPTGIVVASLSFSLAIYGLLTNSLIIFLVSLLFLVLTYFNYIYTLALGEVTNFIKIERSINPPLIREGREAKIKLSLRNLSPIFIPRIEVVDEVPERLKVVKGSPKVVTLLMPKSSIEITYVVKGVGLGNHRFKSIRLYLSDFLGLTIVSLSLSVEGTLKVTPAYLEVHESPFIKGAEISVGPLKAGKGAGYDIVSIREYVSGDDTRRILWKALARTGKLLVREDLSESRPKVLLVIDLSLNNWLGEVGNTQAEWIMRLASSIAYWTLRNLGDMDSIIFYGNKIDVLTNLRGMKGLNDYLLALSSTEPLTSSYYLIRILVDSIRKISTKKHILIFITGREFILNIPLKVLRKLCDVEAQKKFLIIFNKKEQKLVKRKVSWNEAKERIIDYALLKLQKFLTPLNVKVINVTKIEEFFRISRDIEYLLYLR